MNPALNPAQVLDSAIGLIFLVGFVVTCLAARISESPPPPGEDDSDK